jgi:hypothetical protein
MDASDAITIYSQGSGDSMKAYAVAGAICLCAISSSYAAAPVASAASAEQFVRGLYAKYTPNGKPTPFAYPDAKNIVDAQMLALLKKDQDKSNGEVGAMDGDPVCNCQDWDKLKVTSLHTAMQGNGAATAEVAFINAGSSEKIHFSLVWMNGGWRIHDIGTKDQPSLVTYLKTYKY